MGPGQFAYLTVFGTIRARSFSRRLSQIRFSGKAIQGRAALQRGYFSSPDFPRESVPREPLFVAALPDFLRNDRRRGLLTGSMQSMADASRRPGWESIVPPSIQVPAYSKCSGTNSVFSSKISCRFRITEWFPHMNSFGGQSNRIAAESIRFSSASQMQFSRRCSHACRSSRLFVDSALRISRISEPSGDSQIKPKNAKRCRPRHNFATSALTSILGLA